MLLNEKEIKNSQKKLAEISLKIEEKSSWHYLGTDQTRLKIIFLFKFYKEFCPTDFSKILNISISAVSHQLKLLERAGLVKKMRMGRVICYMITKEGRRFLK